MARPSISCCYMHTFCGMIEADFSTINCDKVAKLLPTIIKLAIVGASYMFIQLGFNISHQGIIFEVTGLVLQDLDFRGVGT